MSGSVVQLKQAQSPNRQAMLDMLDGIREQVERGDIISLVALAAHPDKEFSNYSAGDFGSLETIGMLERHKLSLMLRLS